ncbi:hypothetical protein, partial [Rhizobium rhizogenes]|uniref:hypothetical protein n=1 Tax=Rhizobium rhizogenes TaxID=359 RepID=UPI001961DED4
APATNLSKVPVSESPHQAGFLRFCPSIVLARPISASRMALLQKILGVEWNSRRSVFLARKLLFLTARSRALPLSGDCSKPVAIKRRNIFL